MQIIKQFIKLPMTKMKFALAYYSMSISLQCFLKT